MQDTIVALATPTGRSGIGVVRLSGNRSLEFASRLAGGDGFSPKPRTGHFRKLVDPSTGAALDEAIVTYFKGPHSFTGEDLVEISCHGSPVLLRQVIEMCLSLGARLAAPGEFTLRALGNGRIDLAEAEAIRDLIDAQTTAAARQAVRQMQGELSAQLQPLKDDLLNVIVVLESALEFVEDDLPALQLERIRESVLGIARETERLAATFKAGHLIRDGLRVALVGRPNVGKSSLFNALLGIERAIVTDIAGTTRDQLHERLVINDIPVSLIDTAGLRETSDTVESIGVERARGAMADADLVIAMVEADEQLNDEDRDIIKSAAGMNHLIAINKTDLVDESRVSAIAREIEAVDHARTIPISARTGEGLNELRSAMIQPFVGEETSGFLITDARHHDLLLRANVEIRQSIDQLDARMSEEIILVGLYNALRYLGEITGETTTEDMLTRIFATFCIGK